MARARAVRCSGCQAVEYVAVELRKLGLDVKLEEVQVPHWVARLKPRGNRRVSRSVRRNHAQDHLTALGNSTSTGASGITADVVVADSFDERPSRGAIASPGRLFCLMFPSTSQSGEQNSLEAYGEAVIYCVRCDAAAQLGCDRIAGTLGVGGAGFRSPHTGWSDEAGIPAVTAEDARPWHLAREVRCART